MRYFKFVNLGLDELQSEEFGGKKGWAYDECGLCKRLMKTKAFQYHTEGGLVTYIPIKDEVKATVILSKLQTLASSLDDSEVSIVDEDRGAWESEKDLANDAMQYKSDLKEARKQARVELLKARILDPNDDFE